MYKEGKNKECMGFPWWSSCEDSTLPMQGVWVQSLVKEQNSHTPWSEAKKKKKKERKKKHVCIHKLEVRNYRKLCA